MFVCQPPIMPAYHCMSAHEDAANTRSVQIAEADAGADADSRPDDVRD